MNKKTLCCQMSVADTIREDLRSIGRDPLQETRQKVGVLRHQIAYLGGLGQAEMSEKGNAISKELLVQRGRRRRPKSYWEDRLQQDDRVSGWHQMASSAMNNVEQATQNVAELLMTEQEASHAHTHVDEAKRSKEAYWKSIHKLEYVHSDDEEDEFYDTVEQPAMYNVRADKAARNTAPIFARPHV